MKRTIRLSFAIALSLISLLLLAIFAAPHVYATSTTQNNTTTNYQKLKPAACNSNLQGGITQVNNERNQFSNTANSLIAQLSKSSIDTNTGRIINPNPSKINASKADEQNAINDINKFLRDMCS